MFLDYSTGEYPGDYSWDSAGPAASPKACGPARGLHHHLQSRPVPMLASLFLGCRTAAPLGIVLACCSAAALPCLAPYSRRTNGPASVAVADANALQLPLPPKPGWPVSPVLRVLRHAVGHLRQPWDPRDRARQEPPVGARCPVAPVDGMTMTMTMTMTIYIYIYIYIYTNTCMYIYTSIYIYIYICMYVCILPPSESSLLSPKFQLPPSKYPLLPTQFHVPPAQFPLPPSENPPPPSKNPLPPTQCLLPPSEIYTYVYTNTCMYVHLYIYICVCMYIYIYIYVCMYICI